LGRIGGLGFGGDAAAVVAGGHVGLSLGVVVGVGVGRCCICRLVGSLIGRIRVLV
jgi:hypothetical protein